MYSEQNKQRGTVVCLHSSMSHGGQWRALVNRLAADFDVLTPNLLGYDGANNGYVHQLCLEVASLTMQHPGDFVTDYDLSFEAMAAQGWAGAILAYGRRSGNALCDCF